MKNHTHSTKIPSLCMICAWFVHDFLLNHAHTNPINFLIIFLFVHGVHDFLVCVREYYLFSPCPYSIRFPALKGTAQKNDNKNIISHEKKNKKSCTPCTALNKLMFYIYLLLCMIIQKSCTNHAHIMHTEKG